MKRNNIIKDILSVKIVAILFTILSSLFTSPTVSGTPLERVGEALSLMMAGHGIVVLSAPVAVQHLIS